MYAFPLFQDYLGAFKCSRNCFWGQILAEDRACQRRKFIWLLFAMFIWWYQSRTGILVPLPTPPPPLISANRIQCRCLVKDLDTVQVSSACLGLEDCHCTSVFLQGDHLEKHKSDFHPWSFPSLFALAGVTIEKGLHWMPKATIATRLQRGPVPWSRSSAPARGKSVRDGFP